MEGKVNFNKSVDENIRKAFEYGKASVMLPAEEIGNDVYQTLLIEKVSEYFRIYGA